MTSSIKQLHTQNSTSQHHLAVLTKVQYTQQCTSRLPVNWARLANNGSSIRHQFWELLWAVPGNAWLCFFSPCALQTLGVYIQHDCSSVCVYGQAEHWQRPFQTAKPHARCHKGKCISMSLSACKLCCAHVCFCCGVQEREDTLVQRDGLALELAGAY